MTTTSIRRRGRGLHPRRDPVQQLTGVKRCTLPEYLEADEVSAVIAAAPNPRAKLLILLQWRAGLRVSEALALVASMRKLLVMLNAMLKHGYPWRDMTQPVVAHAC